MHRSCRAGRNAWQRLAKGPDCTSQTYPTFQQRAASTAAVQTPTAKATVTAQAGPTPPAPGQGTVTTTTTTTITTTVTTQSLHGVLGLGAYAEAAHAQAIEASARNSDNSKDSKEPLDVIFSGIQPTGIPHLGNYLGALREWKRLQDTAPASTKLIFCIADLHAATVPRSAKEMRENRLNTLATLLAMGLNQDRSTVFFQSDVPQHAELQWVLSCTASTGYLSRMTQWKVSGESRGRASPGAGKLSS